MLWYFAVTLFVSATLLFLVQPMVGKMILPSLGGTPAVWNTCMVFFQAVLLVGYAYTHSLSTYLDRRRQLLVHAALLLLPFLVLPFSMGQWTPPVDHNPVFAVLWLLLGMVGLPFYVVATSAPLLQKWFAFTGHPAAKDPYFLYGASNLGSMLALVLYPILVEPLLDLDSQRLLWTVSYGLLVALIAGCGYIVWRSPTPALLQTYSSQERPTASVAGETAIQAGKSSAAKSETGIKKAQPGLRPPRPWYARHYGKAARQEMAATVPVRDPDEVTWWRRLRWIGLAAIPSSLMLGVTTHITTDIAAIPLFWVLPLALYLLTFILVFARWPVVWTGTPHFVMLFVQPPIVMFYTLRTVAHLGRIPTWGHFLIDLGTFFTTALVCHGELAKDRPSSRRLTEFYLWMSVGGVVGGLFNSLVAPPIFWFGIIEYPLAIVLACLLRPALVGETPLIPGDSWALRKTTLGHLLNFGLPLALGGLTYVCIQYGERFDFRAYFVAVPVVLALLLMLRPVRFGLAVGAVLLVAAAYDRFSEHSDQYIFTDRSFFGLVRVRLDKHLHEGQLDRYYTLIHGGIDHGRQIRSDDLALRRRPGNYFHPASGIGQIFQKFSLHTDHGWPDWRLAASLVGQCASPDQAAMHQLMGFHFSEPPYAVVGLGAGTLACHGKPFQPVDYYEIDPLVLRLSQPDANGELIFTHIEDAKARGAFIDVKLGDGRLVMNKAPHHYYHIILLDAFSSDAIPVHLLTREAVQMYLSKLVDGGVLAFNTTNRYVDIGGVLADIAKELDLVCWTYGGPAGDEGYWTDWIVLQRRRFGTIGGAFNGGAPLDKRFDPERMAVPDLSEDNRWRIQPPNGNPPWTDRYSNLLRVMTWW